MTSWWDRLPNDLVAHILEHRAACVVQKKWHTRRRQQEALYIAVSRNVEEYLTMLHHPLRYEIDWVESPFLWLHSKVLAVCKTDLHYYILYIHLPRD